ncbi:MAG: hypothetical protein JKY95_05560, partial [Planctomycetaceae bacterium]|nr:hypothetical protein [Planctomycetaceae bacterium]
MSTGIVCAADPVREPRVQIAIDRGLAYLRQYDLKYEVATGLVTYTLLAGGDDSSSPAVQRGLAVILKKFTQPKTDLVYRPKQHHIYEASIDIMALQAADSEEYLPQIQAIADHILRERNNVGSWFYPGDKTKGDTSITQYAILGLWAAHRANVEIPIEVFEEAAGWHIQTQGPAGEFYYQPSRQNNKVLSKDPPYATMAVAATGTLGIIRLILFHDQPLPGPPGKKQALKNGPKFGVLVKKNPSDANQSNKTKRTTPKPIQPIIDATNAKTHRWLTATFSQNLVDGHRGFPHYYFYALERASSINHWDTYGDHDWYKEGTDHLLPQQAANGSWPEVPIRAITHPTATCFTLLFLLKATKKIIPTRRRTRPVNLGEGVLAGGRGLPDDLSQVDFENGKIKYKEQQMGSLEQLLAGLSTIDISEEKDVTLEKEKAVDISNPKNLIGNKGLLKSLVTYSDPKVRQAAAWAVGQTDQLELAGLLIPLLKDVDLGVS